MTALSPENPVFTTYAIVSALLVLKVMGQGWMTVYRMMTAKAGFASPEDMQTGPLNRAPHPGQLDRNDYVDRSRRMHRNDLENIPAFWMAGFLFVISEPALWLVQSLMFGFLAARLGHFAAYATRQSHEMRASFYTIGSLIVIYMAVHGLWVLSR